LHFCNILFLTLLIRSGLEILSAHPKLYWNDDCQPRSAWLRLGRGIPDTRQLAPTPQFGHAAIAVSATPDRKTAEFSNKELSMAAALIKAYEGEFDPTQFKDLYQEHIRKIIDAEISNRIPLHPAPKNPTSGPPDLMGQIRLSLDELESKKTWSAQEPSTQDPELREKETPKGRYHQYNAWRRHSEHSTGFEPTSSIHDSPVSHDFSST
jgi:hypothetical protein